MSRFDYSEGGIIWFSRIILLVDILILLSSLVLVLPSLVLGNTPLLEIPDLELFTPIGIVFNLLAIVVGKVVVPKAKKMGVDCSDGFPLMFSCEVLVVDLLILSSFVPGDTPLFGIQERLIQFGIGIIVVLNFFAILGGLILVIKADEERIEKIKAQGAKEEENE